MDRGSFQHVDQHSPFSEGWSSLDEGWSQSDSAPEDSLLSQGAEREESSVEEKPEQAAAVEVARGGKNKAAAVEVEPKKRGKNKAAAVEVGVLCSVMAGHFCSVVRARLSSYPHAYM